MGTLNTPRFAYLRGLEGRRVLPNIANTFLQMNDAKGSLEIPVEICVWLNDENVSNRSAASIGLSPNQLFPKSQPEPIMFKKTTSFFKVFFPTRETLRTAAREGKRGHDCAFLSYRIS